MEDKKTPKKAKKNPPKKEKYTLLKDYGDYKKGASIMLTDKGMRYLKQLKVI